MLVETAVVVNTHRDRAVAFDQLIDHDLASAYRTAAVLLGDWGEAEDATQDALERAWRRWDDLRDEDRARAWFGRILVNVCRDRLRARGGAIVREIPDIPGPDPTGSTDEREAILSALGTLGSDQRVVVVLRFYLDLSLEAIAERTGAPWGPSSRASTTHSSPCGPRTTRKGESQRGSNDPANVRGGGPSCPDVHLPNRRARAT